MLARILTSDWGSSLSTFLPSAKAEMIPHLSRRIFYASTLHDGKKNLSFTPEAFRAINRHRRLGNVDELQNRVKTGREHGLPQRDNRQRFELTSQAAPSTTLSEAREKIETELVQQALKKYLGGVNSAAANLRTSRFILIELMERSGIARE